MRHAQVGITLLFASAAVIVEDFVDKVKGIIWIAYPGPLGGRALADILSGEVNPSGRMPMVTPKRPEDYLPPGINVEPWAADKIDVAPTYPYSHGFKHMWDRDIQPRFPFGWGLSYTSFQHSKLAAELDLGNSRILVRTEVRNTGSQARREFEVDVFRARYLSFLAEGSRSRTGPLVQKTSLKAMCMVMARAVKEQVLRDLCKAEARCLTLDDRKQYRLFTYEASIVEEVDGLPKAGRKQGHLCVQDILCSKESLKNLRGRVLRKDSSHRCKSNR
ncbi:unnamed protein product [Symbiodinium sp. CCMP2456]|nr:unnamed protein product [Symbiodinium sp. CCMP2456]